MTLFDTLRIPAALLLLGFLLASPALPAAPSSPLRAELAPAPEPTVITGVRIFDSRRGVLTPPRDVWIDADGRLETPTLPGTRAPLPTHRVVDGRGRTLLPGLVDSHVHLNISGDLLDGFRLADVDLNLTSFLAAGVTTVFDLGMSRNTLLRWNRQIARGRRHGPQIYAAGLPVTARHGHPLPMMYTLFPGPLGRLVGTRSATQVSSPRQARAAARQRAEQDNPWVKVIRDDIPVGSTQIEAPVFHALVDEAHAHGQRVVVHVGEPDDVALCLEAGADAIVHIPNRGALSAEQARALARRNLAVVPTLVVWDRYRALFERQVDLTPMERALGNPRAVAALEGGAEDPAVPEAFLPWLEENARHFPDTLANVTAIHRAGGRLLAGSDSANVGLFPGAALHLELELLVRAGLSPAEALRAATWTAARFLDPAARFGAILPGWQADLLLVEGDPTRDLDAVHRPVATWSDGRRVHSSVLAP